MNAHAFRMVAALLSLAVAGSLAGCETPFADSADRAAYGIISDGQKRTLQEESAVRIGREMIPVPVTAEDYAKSPATVNRLSTMPAAAQAAATAQSQPAESAAADPLAALLANTPVIDLSNQPELPAFPSPPPAGKTRSVFTLDDSFSYSLAHSRDYQLQKEDLFIAALNVAMARHEFEPQFFATSGMTSSGQGEASDYASALQASQSLGVRQKLPMGGEVVATGLVNALQLIRGTVGDAASAEAALSANLPLLRGAGIVAQENLIQTERSLIYQVRDFERYRRGFLVQVAGDYFSLVNQRAQVLNRVASVKSYIFITQRTAALFVAGVGKRRVTQLDLQRAQQSEFEARNDLIDAIQQYELSVDSFKLRLGMPADQPLDVAPQYLSITPPDVTEAQAVAIAHELRLDLQTTRDQVGDAIRKNKVAANALLPDLELTGKIGAVSDPTVRSVATDNLEYSAGVNIDWGLDREAERDAYRISLITIARAKRAVEQAEDEVAIGVRDSLRRVRQQRYLVSLQRSNIDLAVRRKEFADIQFRNGEIDNRDYLDAEQALLDAQNNFAQSISSLEVATLQYLRDTDQLRVDFNGKLLVPANAAPASTMPAVRVMPPVKGPTIPAEPGQAETAP